MFDSYMQFPLSLQNQACRDLRVSSLLKQINNYSFSFSSFLSFFCYDWRSYSRARNEHTCYLLFPPEPFRSLRSHPASPRGSFARRRARPLIDRSSSTLLYPPLYFHYPAAPLPFRERDRARNGEKATTRRPNPIPIASIHRPLSQRHGGVSRVISRAATICMTRHIIVSWCQADYTSYAATVEYTGDSRYRTATGKQTALFRDSIRNQERTTRGRCTVIKYIRSK